MLHFANKHRCYELLSTLIIEEKHTTEVEDFIASDITYFDANDKDILAAKRRLYQAKDKALEARFYRNQSSSYYLLKHAIDTNDTPLAKRLLFLGVVQKLFEFKLSDNESTYRSHHMLAFDNRNKALTDLFLTGDKHHKGERIRSPF